MLLDLFSIAKWVGGRRRRWTHRFRRRQILMNNWTMWWEWHEEIKRNTIHYICEWQWESYHIIIIIIIDNMIHYSWPTMRINVSEWRTSTTSCIMIHIAEIANESDSNCILNVLCAVCHSSVLSLWLKFYGCFAPSLCAIFGILHIKYVMYLCNRTVKPQTSTPKDG